MTADPLTIEALRAAVTDGSIDTVVMAVVDLQGRLQGKRFDADYFIDDVLAHGTDGCNYLFAVDVEMNTVDGYQISSWDRGYGDFLMQPDLATLRRVPWHPRTAMLLADAKWLDGAPVAESPRQVLRHQLDRLADRGWTALVGTELEFIVFDDTFEQAWERRYAGLTPSNQYNIDYSILGTGRIEPLLHAIRAGMRDAGLQVESAKGECNPGQHEIAFKYADALRTCDNHVIYKTGAKEIAAQHGHSLTFMAKFNEREGNSCHIHLSLRDENGEPLFAAADRAGGLSSLFEHFLAGQLAALRELSYFFAPNINSYKRYQPASFAPTAVAWGLDNRTCSIRVVGHGPSLRMENRIPGGDVNPYLAVAAMIAAGLDGIDNGLPLEPP
jgi:glutamine synthetase